MVPGDGRQASDRVIERPERLLKKVIAFDMESEAQAAGTVISASLLGALAGSGALPFERGTYEEVVRAGGRGVDASLAAFQHVLTAQRARNYRVRTKMKEMKKNRAKSFAAEGPTALLEAWNGLVDRAGQLPEPVQDMALAGLRKVVDYQDIAYGGQFLERLESAVKADEPDHNWRFSTSAAKYLANAMVYDDIIRVADLKLRSSRTDRVRTEVQADPAAVLQVTEYFHPRAQEVCGTLPASIGRWIEKGPRRFALLDRLVNRGRRIRTDTMFGYFSLWVVAGLKPVRRRLLRHAVEEAHVNEWFDRAKSLTEENYDLAVEVLQCRRLIKGYSDTHARGHSKYDRVIGALDMVRERPDAAEALQKLREAALADVEGEALTAQLAQLMEPVT